MRSTSRCYAQKDGAKSFKLSAYVLNLPPVRAYYLARQKILLSKLKDPPTVWIGGHDVSDYIDDFFERRTVVQTGGGVLAYGLSEHVLREHNMSKLFGLHMFHPTYFLYVHSEEVWKRHSSDVSIWRGCMKCPTDIVRYVDEFTRKRQQDTEEVQGWILNELHLQMHLVKETCNPSLRSHTSERSVQGYSNSQSDTTTQEHQHIHILRHRQVC